MLNDIPKEQLAKHASDDMLIFTAVLGFIIGIVLTWIGHKGHVMWMVVWAVGLMIVSILLGASMVFDWELTALRNWFVPQ